MKTEQLKEIGLNDEQIKQVFKLNGLAVEEAKGNAAELEEKLAAKEQEYSTMVEENKQYKMQLEELGEKAKGNEEITSQLEQYKQQMEELKQESEEKIKTLKFDTTLEKTLMGYNVHDVNDIIPQLDREVLKLEDNQILGLEEQINNLKENKSYLFKDDKPAGTGGSVGNPPRSSKQTEDPFIKGFEENFKL